MHPSPSAAASLPEVLDDELLVAGEELVEVEDDVVDEPPEPELDEVLMSTVLPQAAAVNDEVVTTMPIRTAGFIGVVGSMVPQRASARGCGLVDAALGPRSEARVPLCAPGARTHVPGPDAGEPAYVARFDGHARGDVVVLTAPDSGDVLLKRVAAVPGDRVEVHDGALTVNGQPIPVEDRGGVPYEALGAKPHPLDLSDGGGPDLGPVTLPRNRYLVLGDNRGNSRDGRYFGLVDRDAILGHVKGVLLRGGRPTWIGL
jgi:signal peptidase I